MYTKVLHVYCLLLVESDNQINMVEEEVDVFEVTGSVMVCAEIVDVTEIAMGFTAQFDFVDGMLAGKLSVLS